jgi:cell division protein FtsB
MSLHQCATSVRSFLDHPSKVALLCIGVFGVSIVLNGNIWRLWSLHRDFDRIGMEIHQKRDEISSLSSQLKQAKDPAFIERQARDKLDLVSEHDLVFVFSDQ